MSVMGRPFFTSIGASMCDVTTALMVGSAAAGLFSAQQQANSISDSNQRQYENTLQARTDNANQITLEQRQQAEGASQKIMANDSATRDARSTAIAQAGPSGLSVDALIGDINRKGATYNQSVNANLDRVNMSLDNQLTNVNRGAASEINSLRTPAQPDYLGTALRIGGDYYKANGNPFSSPAVAGGVSDGSRAQRSS